MLSTHIVEDVAVLCPRFAIIRNGRLVANTTPGEAREAIDGTIYEGMISTEEYDGLLADPDRSVTQGYLVEGRNRVRVYQPEGSPPDGFMAVASTLEDAYLVAIKTGRLNGLGFGELPHRAAAAASANGHGADSRPARPERGES